MMPQHFFLIAKLLFASRFCSGDSDLRPSSLSSPPLLPSLSWLCWVLGWPSTSLSLCSPWTMHVTMLLTLLLLKYNLQVVISSYLFITATCRLCPSLSSRNMGVKWKTISRMIVAVGTRAGEEAGLLSYSVTH